MLLIHTVHGPEHGLSPRITILAAAHICIYLSFGLLHQIVITQKQMHVEKLTSHHYFLASVQHIRDDCSAKYLRYNEATNGCA